MKVAKMAFATVGKNQKKRQEENNDVQHYSSAANIPAFSTEISRPDGNFVVDTYYPSSATENFGLGLHEDLSRRGSSLYERHTFNGDYITSPSSEDAAGSTQQPSFVPGYFVERRYIRNGSITSPLPVVLANDPSFEGMLPDFSPNSDMTGTNMNAEVYGDLALLVPNNDSWLSPVPLESAMPGLKASNDDSLSSGSCKLPQ
jgi:hypothetical protein